MKLGVLISLIFHGLLLFPYVKLADSVIGISSSNAALVVTVTSVHKSAPKATKATAKKEEPLSGKAGVVEDKKVELVGNLAPEYPWRARMQAHEGTVVVDLFVTKEGAANQIKVAKSSGYKSLDEAAINAVSKATFTSHNQELYPMQLSLNFKLKESQ